MMRMFRQGIIRQDLPFGSRVGEQRSSKSVCKQGPRVQSVPSVVGESLDKAEAVLLQSGLGVAKVIRVHSTSAEKDRVIARNRPPARRLLKDYACCQFRAL